MTEPIKPFRLRPGDTVAVVSPSWGGPSRYPHVFDLGLANLQDRFGVMVKEYPTARRDADELYRDPEARAADLNAAFADPDVRAIITSIGGDDSIRILRHLDVETIRANPKIFMGYSDTTTMTTFLNQHGLVTFNGPAIMAGFAQLRHLPDEFTTHIRKMLMDPQEETGYLPYPVWGNNYRDWSTPGYDGEMASVQPHDGWRWLQGSGRTEGRLLGGCMDVFEFLKATPYWPEERFWDGKILFFETSEEKPPVEWIGYWLRNYGVSGVLQRVSGILFGRFRSYSEEQKRAVETRIVDVVAGEFGLTELPIVANLDFGHTDPQWIMPLGVRAEIDCDGRRLNLLEAAVR